MLSVRSSIKTGVVRKACSVHTHAHTVKEPLSSPHYVLCDDGVILVIEKIDFP